MGIMNDLITLLKTAVDNGTTTIAEISQKSECSRQYVYNVLNRKSDPTLHVAEKMAAAVGVSFVLSSKNKAKRKISA